MGLAQARPNDDTIFIFVSYFVLIIQLLVYTTGTSSVAIYSSRAVWVYSHSNRSSLVRHVLVKLQHGVVSLTRLITYHQTKSFPVLG